MPTLIFYVYLGASHSCESTC